MALFRKLTEQLQQNNITDFQADVLQWELNYKLPKFVS
jgi:hypothetical protein